MDNLKSPAYPQPIILAPDGTIAATYEYYPQYAGLTKLERASLMIAAAYRSNPSYKDDTDSLIAALSVSQATAILKEANK